MKNDLTHFDKLLIAARYWLLGMAENDHRYFQVLSSLEFALEHHDGTRNGGDHEFVHQLGIFHYLRTMHKHIVNPHMVYMLVFLHDALEDPNQKTKKEGKPRYVLPSTIEARFGEAFLTKLTKMSKEIVGVKNPAFSLAEIFGDEDCSLAKGADRVNNVSSMVGVFKLPRLLRYVTETKEEFLPLLKKARRDFPKQEAIYQNMQLELSNQLELIDRIITEYRPEND